MFAKWSKLPNWLLIAFFGVGIYIEQQAPYHQPKAKKSVTVAKSQRAPLQSDSASPGRVEIRKSKTTSKPQDQERASVSTAQK